MARLGLTLHPEKTRVLDARRDAFMFLGHTHRWQRGRLHLDVSPKALRRIRDELRRKTRRTGWSLPAMVADSNPYIRGARHYFRRVRRRTLRHSIPLSISASRAGGRGNMRSAGLHGRSCPEGRSGANTAWSGGICRCGSVQLTKARS